MGLICTERERGLKVVFPPLGSIEPLFDSISLTTLSLGRCKGSTTKCTTPCRGPWPRGLTAQQRGKKRDRRTGLQFIFPVGSARSAASEQSVSGGK
jgi:hypothetical protein